MNRISVARFLRFMKLRNPKIAQVQVDQLIDDTILRDLDSSVPGEITKPVAESNKLSEKTKRKVLGENAGALLGS